MTRIVAVGVRFVKGRATMWIGWAVAQVNVMVAVVDVDRQTSDLMSVNKLAGTNVPADVVAVGTQPFAEVTLLSYTTLRFAIIPQKQLKSKSNSTAWNHRSS